MQATKSIAFIALLLFVGRGIALASIPVPVVSPSLPPVDPKVTAKAKEWFYRFQTADVDRSQLNDAINSQLTDDMIRQEAVNLKKFGAPTSMTYVRTYGIKGVVGYDFLWEFKAARIVEMIALDPDGKIAGIDFQAFVPASPAP